MDAVMTKEAKMGYLAGMIDGEGHIGVYKTMGRKNMRYRARVCVINGDIRVMDWLVNNFGGFIKSKKAYSDKHRESFIWQLPDNLADKVLFDVLPYLVIKQEQARIVLAYRKLQKTYRTHPGYTNISNSVREDVYFVMKKLNMRGPSKSVETNTPDIGNVLMKIESELMSNHKNRICEGLVARN